MSQAQDPLSNVVTTIRIQELLDENFELIKLVTENQKNANQGAANAYAKKLHENLTMMAQVADAQIPNNLNEILAEKPAPASVAMQPCPVRLLPVSAVQGSTAAVRAAPPQAGQGAAARPAGSPATTAHTQAGQARGTAPASAAHAAGQPLSGAPTGQLNAVQAAQQQAQQQAQLRTAQLQAQAHAQAQARAQAQAAAAVQAQAQATATPLQGAQHLQAGQGPAKQFVAQGAQQVRQAGPSSVQPASDTTQARQPT